MGKWLITLLLCIILLQNNCATTTLLKTESEYRPVSPVKLKIGCNAEIPKDKIHPQITLNLTTETLHQKYQIEHYKTSYQWQNRALLFGIATAPWFAMAIVWWNERNVNGEYPARVYGLTLGTLGLLATAFGADDFPSKSKYWKRELVFPSDTLYKNPQILSKDSIAVESFTERKTFITDEKGKAVIDIRDFYTDVPKDSNLPLTIGYKNFSTQVKVPNDYLTTVRNYEDEAKRLFIQAQNKEESGKYEEALEDYRLVTEKYPISKASIEAKSKIGVVQGKITEKQIAEIRKKLQRVSDEKVRRAIAGLGLDEYQSNTLASIIDNLSGSSTAEVIKVGLGMPLADAEAIQEYRNLILFQKFYAVVCYITQRLGSISAEDLAIEPDAHYYTIQECAQMLRVSEEIIGKLSETKPDALLTKK